MTNQELREFYFSQLLSKGWMLRNDLSGPQANYTNAEFYKSGRFLSVKTYSTLKNDGVGEPIPAGFKIEIWFK